jgi:hypothetical protein
MPFQWRCKNAICRQSGLSEVLPSKCPVCGSEDIWTRAFVKKELQKIEERKIIEDESHLGTKKNICHLICFGHGSWDIRDDTTILPRNVTVYFGVPDNTKYPGTGEVLMRQIEPGYTKRGGDVIPNYRLWALTGDEAYDFRAGGGLNVITIVEVIDKLPTLRGPGHYILLASDARETITLEEICHLLPRDVEVHIEWQACREHINNNRIYIGLVLTAPYRIRTPEPRAIHEYRSTITYDSDQFKEYVRRK